MKRIVTFLLVLVMVAGMIPATVWAAEAYTITFDPNGGTCATETVTVNEGEAIGTLPVPVREDRIFKGWYLDVENGTRITEEEVFAESTTLYAKWGYAAWFNDDYYYLGNKASGIGLVNNGSKVELGERYSEASRWHFVMQEDYTFKVISAVDGSVLDVTEDGTPVRPDALIISDPGVFDLAKEHAQLVVDGLELLAVAGGLLHVIQLVFQFGTLFGGVEAQTADLFNTKGAAAVEGLQRILQADLFSLFKTNGDHFSASFTLMTGTSTASLMRRRNSSLSNFQP